MEKLKIIQKISEIPIKHHVFKKYQIDLVEYKGFQFYRKTKFDWKDNQTSRAFSKEFPTKRWESCLRNFLKKYLNNDTEKNN